MSDRYQILCTKIQAEFPRFEVRNRDNSWLGPIFWCMRKITKQNYDNFVTTIGSTVYVGPAWADRSPNSKYKTMRHELIHMRQFQRWPLGRWAWPLNFLLVSIAYLLILPVLWTFRARFEREGYTQTMLVHHELGNGISDAKMEEIARKMATFFGGSYYAWMWRKKPAYEWAMTTMRKINAGEITNEKDRVSLPPQ